MSALDFPDYKATVHAYGTVIGTGNAIIGWDPKKAKIQEKACIALVDL